MMIQEGRLWRPVAAGTAVEIQHQKSKGHHHQTTDKDAIHIKLLLLYRRWYLKKLRFGLAGVVPIN